ncbi:NYN domain-containing protein [Patescibacteria group bacterium]|nr:NYN domain-containing protein [Patescibacteria group bacterium]
MDIKIEKLLESLKDKKIGVFVDDSNLYHSYKKYGWRIDFGKFRILLERYCDLKFINYHIAIPAKSDDVFHGTEIFLQKIVPFVKFKKKLLKYTPVAGKFMKKADTDIEITLDVVRNIDNLDVVIIVSGDSDFLELKNYVVRDKKKNILFVGYEENMAWELRQCWHLYVNRIKDEVTLQ